MTTPSQVIVRLSGGLGNQMFQYAFGRAVAAARGTGLVLSTFPLGLRSPDVTPRRYALDVFELASDVAVSSQGYSVTLNRAAKRLPTLARLMGEHHEQSPDFYPGALTAPATTFEGYWQSHRYFEPVGERLLRDFTLKGAPGASFCALLAQVSQPGAVMVHVRRGDYVSLAAASGHHGALGPEYYRDAVAQVVSRVPSARCFVFSDDIAWCRGALYFLPADTHFVEPDGARTDAQDLILMSACTHAIIANSSFSWWGAWLGDRRHTGAPRLVCAPLRWFAGGSANAASRFPKSWTAL